MNERMRLVFYKAFQPKATLVDNAIATFTFGRYSHVELLFPNNECFSISARDKVGRFKHIKLNEEQWDIFTLTEHFNPELMRHYAKEYVGYKYDYIGALFSISPICVQKNKRIFCSEVVTNLLNRFKAGKFLGDGCKYSPTELLRATKGKICTNIR